MNLALRNDLSLPVGFWPSDLDEPFGRWMNGILEDMLTSYGLPSTGRSQQNSVSMPRINLIENEKAYEVEAELPGVSKDDVKISVHQNRVSIEAEVKHEEEKKDGEQVVYAERSVRKFARSFTLPAEVDSGQAQAKMENGILKLTLPKTAETQTRRIAIQ